MNWQKHRAEKAIDRECNPRALVFGGFEKALAIDDGRKDQEYDARNHASHRRDLRRREMLRLKRNSAHVPEKAQLTPPNKSEKLAACEMYAISACNIPLRARRARRLDVQKISRKKRPV